MHQDTTLVEAAATLAAETTGYLAADHVIRRVHPSARAATAAALAARYRAESAFDAGFLRRLIEFAAESSAAPHSGR